MPRSQACVAARVGGHARQDRSEPRTEAPGTYLTSSPASVSRTLFGWLWSSHLACGEAGPISPYE